MEGSYKEDATHIHTSGEGRDVPRTAIHNGNQVISGALADSLKKLHATQEEKGISTGIDALDISIGGYQAPDLYTIAARTGIGKSAMITQSLKTAVMTGHKSLIFSVEMTYEQVGHRMIINHGKIDSSFIRKQPENQGEIEIVERLLKKSANELIAYQENLFVCDKSGVSIGEISEICRNMKANGGLDIVFVDYMQLVPGSKDSRKRDRHIEVGEVSTGLKNLARELSIPIVGAAQLKRPNVRDNKKMPGLSDLRESGSLEQDSDLVIMIHRDADEDGIVPSEGEATLTIPKLRNGAGEALKLYYVGKNYNFKSIDFNSWVPHDEEINHNTCQTTTSALWT